MTDELIEGRIAKNVFLKSLMPKLGDPKLS